MNVTDTNTYISQIRTQATNLIATIQKLSFFGKANTLATQATLGARERGTR